MTKEKSGTYKTLDQINRPVYLNGFVPLHWALMLIGIMVFSVVSLILIGPIVGTGLSALFLLFLMRIGKSIAKQNNEGNPDYIESNIDYIITPKVIEDENCVMYILMKKNERN